MKSSCVTFVSAGHLKELMDEIFHVKDTERRLWLKKLPNNYILLKDDQDKLENFTLSGDNLVRYQIILHFGSSPRGPIINFSMNGETQSIFN
jgi:hypothetical protein